MTTHHFKKNMRTAILLMLVLLLSFLSAPSPAVE
jgi:hypothetical protein